MYIYVYQLPWWLQEAYSNYPVCVCVCYHLISETLQKTHKKHVHYFNIKVTWSSCTCITSPAKHSALSKLCVKIYYYAGRQEKLSLEQPFLAVMPIFFHFFLKSQFDSLTFSMEGFKQFTTKLYILDQQYLSSLWIKKCFAFTKWTFLNMHAVMPR